MLHIFKKVKKAYQSRLYPYLSISAVLVLSIGAFLYSYPRSRGDFPVDYYSGDDLVIVAGDETSSDTNNTNQHKNATNSNANNTHNATQKIEGAFFINNSQFSFQNGVLKLKNNSINSEKIQRHAIESKDIDSNSITSRTIRNHTIQGEDIDKNTDVTIDGLSTDNITAQNLKIAETIDFGTNTITDGILTGNWDFQNGNILTAGLITGNFSGTFAPSDDIDMANHILTNIGNAGTEFTNTGGLILAGDLTLTGTSGILKSTAGLISGSATTTDLPEGLNQYWTQGRFDVAFSGKTTTNLAEGTNLYYLDSRARAAISETITGIGYDNLTGIFSLTAGYVVPTTAEQTNWNTAYSHSQATSNVHGLTFTAEGSDGGLDADLLDGQHGSYYAPISNINGTINYLSKFTGTNSIGNSLIYDDGTNVGIGTTGPAANLHLYSTGSTNQYIESAANNSAAAWFYDGTNWAGIGLNANDLLVLTRNGNINNPAGLVINSAGNVGIGTVDPLTKLTVGNDTVAVSQMTLWGQYQSSGFTNSNILNFRHGGLDRVKLSTVQSTASSNAFDFKIQAINATVDGYNDWVTVKGMTGKVGIGTTSPEAMLEVTGNNPSGALVRLNSFSTYLYGLELANGSTSAWQIAGRPNDNNNLYISAGVNTPDGPTLIDAAKVTITTSGNVGIGTTAPGAKLEVRGDMQVRDSVTPSMVLTFGQLSESASLIQSSGLLFLRSGSMAGISLQTNGNNNRLSIDATGNFNFNAGQMFIQQATGNVGIGTTSPQAKLEIYAAQNSTSQFTSPFIRLNPSSIIDYTGFTGISYGVSSIMNNYGWTVGSLRTEATASSHAFVFNSHTSVSAGSEVLRLISTGNVGIGTTNPNTKLQVTSTSDENVVTISDSDGTCTLNPESGGSWSCTSDERLKKDIISIDGSLSKIMNLRPVSFQMKQGGDTNSGFIAQEVQPIIPAAVSLLPNGYLGVAEGKFIPYLVGAIQELSSQSTVLSSQSAGHSQQFSALSLQYQELLTDNQQLTLSIDSNITTLEELKDSINKQINKLQITHLKLQEQMEEIKAQSSPEEVELVKTELDSIKIALNVSGSDVTVLGNLSIAKNIDLLSGKLTAQEVRVLGVMKARDVEAEESLKGENLELGNEVKGTTKLKAGEKSVTIQTNAVSKDAQIFLTPKGRYEKLYYDENDITEGESFRVKIDEPADNDIEFNWLIIK